MKRRVQIKAKHMELASLFLNKLAMLSMVSTISVLTILAALPPEARAQGADAARTDPAKEQRDQDFDKELEKAVSLKDKAVADLERDLARAKDKIDNAKLKDIDNALADAQNIKKEAIARFDRTLAEAVRIKQAATAKEAAKAKLVADLEAAKQDAEAKFPSATKTVRKDVAEIKSLARDGKPSGKPATRPAIKSATETKKTVPSGTTISLKNSGTPAGPDVEQLTDLPKRIKHTRLSDEVIALQEVPQRPETLFHLGEPFFGVGPIEEGFEIPTGAVWQPQFFPFGSYNMAIQTYDDGNQQVNEWVNTLDVYGNLNLTPTERFLIGFNFLDKDGRFTGYEFYPEKKSLNAANGNVATLFFEGRFDSLFPSLKSKTGNWASFDFSIGRQPLSYQSGMLINDTIDAVGITRTSTYLLGSNATTITGVYGWNFINRGDNKLDKNAMMFGLFSTLNYPSNQIEADMVVVFDTGSNPRNSLNLAVSSFQTWWELVNVTFRINQSIALNGSSEGSGTGTLFFAQFNMQTPYTVNNLYLNLFGGINKFTSAARGPNAGGPLGQTGLLFAATGLGNFGSALQNDGQDVFGGSIGYQMYLGTIRRQLILEFGGTTRDRAVAFGGQFEQAFGRHFLWTLGSFVSYAENRLRRIGYGARSVWSINF